MAGSRRPFPLVPRHRANGVAYGTQRSLRKGQGAEVAGARPYRPGDRLAWIDWNTSARMSLVQDDDVFVVREYYAEVAPRVVVVVDRHPSLGLFPPGLPWLRKPNVLRHAVTAIVAAGLAARAYVGYLDLGGDASSFWIAPHRQGAPRILKRHLEEFDGPDDGLELALDYLLGLPQDVPAGCFVFVLSDFLHPPPAHVWSRAVARRWDVVPVIVQDPTWEQSFPEVGGLLLPVADPATGKRGAVRLARREASRRRAANEERLRGLRHDFRRLGYDSVLLDVDDPAATDLAFVEWASRRAQRRGRAR